MEDVAQQKVCVKKPSCFGRLLNFGGYAKCRLKSELFAQKAKSSIDNYCKTS